MSLRPRQVADEASRFTLRSIFGSSEAEAAHVQEPRIAETAPLLLNRPCKTDSAQIGAGLTFMLPTVHATRPVSGPAPNRFGGDRMLQAGLVTNNKAPEIVRLNGVVEQLRTQLNKSTTRVEHAETSVARGNAALQTERATSHARIVALTTELKDVQHRETAVRIELAALPKLSKIEATELQMQADAAIELQASYQKEVKRVEDIEIAMAEATDRRALLVEENVALFARLQTATAELASARELATNEDAQTHLKAENETLHTLLDAATSDLTAAKALATAAIEDDTRLNLVAENETLKTQLDLAELANAHELATSDDAQTRLKAENKTLHTLLDAATSDLTAAESLATAAIDEDTRFDLVAENETLRTQLDLAELANAHELSTNDDTRGRLVTENEALKTQLEVATAELASTIEVTDAMLLDRRMYDELVSRNMEMQTQLESAMLAAAERPVADDEHSDLLVTMSAALEEARQQIVTKTSLVEAEQLRGAEADALIKDLDSKLAMARAADVTASAAVSEEVKRAALADLGRYATLKQHAQYADVLVRSAGPDAAEYMKDDANFLYTKARRCYSVMEHGNCNEEQTMCFETPCQAHTVDVAAVRCNLATQLNVNGYRNAVGCTTQDDCDVDFHDITVATGFAPMWSRHKTEDTGLKMRTDKYVSAVMDDIKAKLLVESKNWKESATGVQ